VAARCPHQCVRDISHQSRSACPTSAAPRGATQQQTQGTQLKVVGSSEAFGAGRRWRSDALGGGAVVGTAGLNFHRVTKENLGDTDLLGRSGVHWASQCEAARLTY